MFKGISQAIISVLDRL